MENIDELINKYIKASMDYGKAQEEGKFRKVNKCADEIRKIRAELRKDSLNYIERLNLLLEHDDKYVRLYASYDLLPILTESAEKVLAELSNEKGLLGFEAEMLLQEWKKGNLKFNV